jgi:hypothetical protein
MKRKTKNRIERKAKINYLLIKNKVFDDCCYRGLNETVERIKKYNHAITGLLNFWRLIEKFPEKRTGDEIYGYKSLTEINSDLSYISDRFNSEARLIWLLDVPKKVGGLENDF